MWPLWRAVSSIRCMSTHRSVTGSFRQLQRAPGLRVKVKRRDQLAELAAAGPVLGQQSG